MWPSVCGWVRLYRYMCASRLSRFALWHGIDYSFCWITFILHMQVVDDEITLLILGHRVKVHGQV